MNKHLKCVLKVAVGIALAVPYLLVFVFAMIVGFALTLPWMVADISGCVDHYADPPFYVVGETFADVLDSWRNL